MSFRERESKRDFLEGLTLQMNLKEDKELARQRMKKLLDRGRKCGKALCASAWHRASM